MNPAGVVVPIIPFLMQGGGAVLFGLVFLFLWRQSGMVYFGLWSAAWMVQAAAVGFGHLFLTRGDPWWLVPYAVLEYSFAVLLVAAARAGFSGSMRDWRIALRLLAFLPFFVGLVFALGWNSLPEAYHASHAVVLCFAYFYNYMTLRGTGVARGVFRFSLLLLVIAFMQHAMVSVWLMRSGLGPAARAYLSHDLYFDFGLHAVLTFAAMAMWIENQQQRVERVVSELDRVRREQQETLDLDRLTGLLNQSALARRMEEATDFRGVVGVCDMDSFKEINDRFGHLAGDEILRNIGHLLRSSIRQEDEAFRWGGDEFVILFRNQKAEVARKRMADIEARLRDFRLRGHGVLPISFSWGISEVDGLSLREALDEADRNMYAFKRSRA